MRIYNGKPLINSVNGKRESMEQVFPLMKKYGASAVVLTLDEEGIPATAQGRVDIARRVIQEAARYGISKKDLVVDCLAMTISAKQDSAGTTGGLHHFWGFQYLLWPAPAGADQWCLPAAGSAEGAGCPHCQPQLPGASSGL